MQFYHINLLYTNALYEFLLFYIKNQKNTVKITKLDLSLYLQ